MEGLRFGAFISEARTWMGEIAEMIGGLVVSMEDMQAKLDAQNVAITQQQTDFGELTARVDALVSTVGSQVSALQAANDELTAQRDALQAQLGADDAAVAAANSAIDANTGAISQLSTAMDAFHAAEVTPEPPAEPMPPEEPPAG